MKIIVRASLHNNVLPKQTSRSWSRSINFSFFDERLMSKSWTVPRSMSSSWHGPRRSW